jgi:hypothetical protein
MCKILKKIVILRVSNKGYLVQTSKQVAIHISPVQTATCGKQPIYNFIGGRRKLDQSSIGQQLSMLRS